MNADQIIEYANAVQAYKNAQENHAEAVADAHQAVNEAALELSASEQTLRECIERIGSDPMNVLKKQRVRVTDEDREMVLAALLRDSGTEAEVAKDAGVSVEVTRLALRHLSRIGKASKDGRGAKAVWSAATPGWSEQTAPSIADEVNALLVDEGAFAEPVQHRPVF